MDEESSEYSRLSAEYCESLFSVVAFFFSCNVEVERAVLSERPQDEAARSLALEFGKFGSMVKVLERRFDDFSRIHRACGIQSSRASIEEQASSVAEFSSLVLRIHELFSEQSDCDSLQERIWQDDEYTRTFVDAARKVTAMIDWQCSLAEAANLE